MNIANGILCLGLAIGLFFFVKEIDLTQTQNILGIIALQLAILHFNQK